MKTLVLNHEKWTGCPLNCANYTHSKRYATYIDGPEYETIGMLGSNLLLEDIEDVQYLNYLCDDYGMDTIAVGGTIAFAMECYDKGILKREDLVESTFSLATSRRLRRC